MDNWPGQRNAERLVVEIEYVSNRWHTDHMGASAALDAWLRAASPSAVMILERAYRGRHRPLAVLVSTDAQALRRDYGPHAAAVAALMTFDRSGFLREAGVRFLGGVDEPFVLPFLLLRLNDPVAPVRALAAEVVGRRLTGDDADLLVRLLPLVDGLARRRHTAATPRLVTRLLVDQERAGPTALWAGARGSDPAVRASCLRVLATVDPVRALTQAMATGDPSLRHWAAAVATAPKTHPDVRRQVLPVLERDANPRIRWRALRVRARQPDSDEHVRRALFDPDARVRYLARASLRARGRTIVVQVYRAALTAADASRETTIGALAGLADMGSRDDTDLVEPLLRHPHARVRGEAWRALAVLAPDRFAARLDQLRADPSGKVRRYLPAADRLPDDRPPAA